DWNDKGQWSHQERGMADHQPAFDHAFLNHSEVKLGQVANAAVGKLGRFTASAAGEIGFFHQCNPVAACGGIQGYACPGDAASDHQHIKLLLGQTFQIHCS